MPSPVPGLHRVGLGALLGFEDEEALFVEVDESEALASAFVKEDCFALEDVTVAVGIAGFRIGTRNAQEVAELAEERLTVRFLRRGGGLPSGDEFREVQALQCSAVTSVHVKFGQVQSVTLNSPVHAPKRSISGRR